MSSLHVNAPHRAALGGLLLAAGLPVVVATWLVLSAPVVLSTEMTWDLLFNLAGAWHLHFGHLPHIDFHEPIGTLAFLLTEWGFRLVGPSPRALLVGMALVAAAIFAFACWVAHRRLALLPAAVFVVFVCLLVIRPANVGDRPNAYSFAMTYNRYGWSGLAIIALVLFQPPVRRGLGDIVDMAAVAGLLAALFFLKITYFVVAVAAVPVALAACPHVRERWPGWSVVLLLALGLVLAPTHRPYLADLKAAADAGIVRNDTAFFFNDFAENLGEYAPYLAGLGLALWLWRRGVAPFRLPAAAAFLLSGGIALLSQNSQDHGVPLAVVIAFLFWDTLRERPLALRLAVLVLPLAAVGAAVTSIIGYHARATGPALFVFVDTNLRGLAVPSETDGLLTAFSTSRETTHHLLGRARAVRPRYELSPYEYAQTLHEAADLLRNNDLAQGPIALLDQVNPLPFMLGTEPPRGGNLWSGAGAPVPSAEAYLGEADTVLIPKFATNLAWGDVARTTYQPYLARHFTPRIESRSWIVLRRSWHQAR